MRIKAFLINTLLLSTSHTTAWPSLNLDLAAQSAIVVNADTGAILYEKNAHTPQFPASTTKIATALYTVAKFEKYLQDEVAAEKDSIVWVCEKAKRQSNYAYPSHWLETGASHVAIEEGERFRLETLLGLMLIASADDASNCIAAHLGGSVPNFMDGLNQFLAETGCRNTHFENPHGLHHPKHVSTAYDLAILAREALRYPMIKQMVHLRRYDRPLTNKKEATTVLNGNKLLRLGPFHDTRALGIKTGYTSDAKNCFVAAAEQNGRTLIAVLLREDVRDTMFREAIEIFNQAFAETKQKRTVVKKGNQNYTLKLDKAAKPIHVYTENSLNLEFFPLEEPKVVGNLLWNENLSLPISQGERIGEIEVTNDQGKVLGREPVYAAENVNLALWPRLQLWLWG